MPTNTQAHVNIEVDDDASWRLLWMAASLCPVCQYYAARRFRVVPLAVAIAAARADLDAHELYMRFMGSVHARHLAGESLSTRHHTPVEWTTGPGGEKSSRLRVQRGCNGCGSSLGDANDAELDAAMSGAPLPDVRLECGCYDRPEVAA